MEDSLGFVEFSDRLASKAPVPGGGGASAAVGALSCALGQMVCNLTVGKERYADVQDETAELLAWLEDARRRMLALVDEDAEAFEVLATAYGIPKDEPRRADSLEAALECACKPPLHIMELAARIVERLERLAKIGSRMALSDVGVAAAFSRATLEGASLNIYINAQSMADRQHAQELCSQADGLIAGYVPKAQGIVEEITRELKGQS